MKARRRVWSRVVAALLLVVATGFVACATSGMTREERPHRNCVWLRLLPTRWRKDISRLT